MHCKASDRLLRVLNNARKNGVQQGLREEQMFIKTLTCGKALWFKKLDIKGRGRQGIIRVPKSSIKLVLEEKNPIDYYKMMLQGKTPPGLGNTFKMMLTHSEADFDKV